MEAISGIYRQPPWTGRLEDGSGDISPDWNLSRHSSPSTFKYAGEVTETIGGRRKSRKTAMEVSPDKGRVTSHPTRFSDVKNTHPTASGRGGRRGSGGFASPGFVC
jgi:hypothetical protein